MERPDVDGHRTALSPSISIEQKKTTSRSPRSTVGTITENLRLIFAFCTASIGKPHCPNCGKENRPPIPPTRSSAESSPLKSGRPGHDPSPPSSGPGVRASFQKGNGEACPRQGFTRARRRWRNRQPRRTTSSSTSRKNSHRRSRSRPPASEARHRRPAWENSA